MVGQVNWQISGDYFENCSCDVVCPCLVSPETARRGWRQRTMSRRFAESVPGCCSPENRASASSLWPRPLIAGGIRLGG